MIKATLLGLLALVSSCSGPMAIETEQIEQTSPVEEIAPAKAGQVGTDNHLWEGKEFTLLNFQIKVREYQSYADLAKAYKRETGITVPKGLVLYGYTTWPLRPSRKYCVINIMDPDVDYKPEIIGHELLHCMHGNFHPNHLKRIGFEK